MVDLRHVLVKGGFLHVGCQDWLRMKVVVNIISYLQLCTPCIPRVFCRLIESRYAETIDLIYRMNTFHTSRIALVENLPSLLLPQRLAIITSLELVWGLLDHHVNPQLSDNHCQLPGEIWSIYNTLMGTVPVTFPSTTKQCVSVNATYHILSHIVADVEWYESRLLELLMHWCEDKGQSYGLVKLRQMQVSTYC